MCGCAKPSRQPRQTRSSPVVIVSRNTPTISTTNSPAPPNTLTAIQAMDPDRLRIEQLRREAIRRSFGSTS
jgi:hypothetical protein